MTDQELQAAVAELFYSGEDKWFDYKDEFIELRERIKNAAIAHVKSQYTLCEKEPDSHKDVHINGKWKTVPLYREAKS